MATSSLVIASAHLALVSSRDAPESSTGSRIRCSCWYISQAMSMTFGATPGGSCCFDRRHTRSSVCTRLCCSCWYSCSRLRRVGAPLRQVRTYACIDAASTDLSSVHGLPLLS
eukprot:151738-Rhodomonas_salina.1